MITTAPLPSIVPAVELHREVLRDAISSLIQLSMGLDSLCSGLGLHEIPDDTARLAAVQRDAGRYARLAYTDAVALLPLLPSRAAASVVSTELDTHPVNWLLAELAELEKLTEDRTIAERVLLRDYPTARDLLGIDGGAT